MLGVSVWLASFQAQGETSTPPGPFQPGAIGTTIQCVKHFGHLMLNVLEETLCSRSFSFWR